MNPSSDQDRTDQRLLTVPATENSQDHAALSPTFHQGIYNGDFHCKYCIVSNTSAPREQASPRHGLHAPHFPSRGSSLGTDGRGCALPAKSAMGCGSVHFRTKGSPLAYVESPDSAAVSRIVTESP